MHVRLSKTFSFEAGHDLSAFPDGHKCREPHGHSYKIEVCVEGEVDEKKGYLVDYGEIRSAAEPIRKALDHSYLNKIDGLENPTAENLARWIWDRIKANLPLLSAVVVYETDTSRCEYRGE